MTDDRMVAALLREREGYAERGLSERVAAVDAEIRRLGGTPPDDGPPAKQETTARAPRARRAPGTDKT